MAEYLIAKKYLGQKGTSTVKNSQGLSQFLLVGTWGSGANILSVYALDGSLLATVKKVPWSFGSRYDLFEQYEKVGTLKKAFPFPVDFFYIPSLGWTVSGDVKGHHYTIRHFKKVIMSMSTATFPTGEYFVLTIPQEKNAPLAICVASVLDNWLYNTQKEKCSNFKPGYTTN